MDCSASARRSCVASLGVDPLALIAGELDAPARAADPARADRGGGRARRRGGAAALGAGERAERATAGPPARPRLRRLRGRPRPPSTSGGSCCAGSGEARDPGGGARRDPPRRRGRGPAAARRPPACARRCAARLRLHPRPRGGVAAGALGGVGRRRGAGNAPGRAARRGLRSHRRGRRPGSRRACSTTPFRASRICSRSGSRPRPAARARPPRSWRRSPPGPRAAARRGCAPRSPWATTPPRASTAAPALPTPASASRSVTTTRGRRCSSARSRWPGVSARRGRALTPARLRGYRTPLRLTALPPRATARRPRPGSSPGACRPARCP